MDSCAEKAIDRLRIVAMDGPDRIVGQGWDGLDPAEVPMGSAIGRYSLAVERIRCAHMG
jgi:hypothetical protein